jgi:hypothetical protein
VYKVKFIKTFFFFFFSSTGISAEVSGFTSELSDSLRTRFLDSTSSARTGLEGGMGVIVSGVSPEIAIIDTEKI